MSDFTLPLPTRRFFSTCPELVERIGRDETHLLLTLEYHLKHLKAKTIAGRKWIYRSMTQLGQDAVGWSKTKVHRIIKRLVDCGLILVGDFPHLFKFDHTHWYTIAVERVKEILKGDGRSISERVPEMAHAEETSGDTGSFHFGTSMVSNRNVEVSPVIRVVPFRNDYKRRLKEEYKSPYPLEGGGTSSANMKKEEEQTHLLALDTASPRTDPWNVTKEEIPQPPTDPSVEIGEVIEEKTPVQTSVDESTEIKLLRVPLRASGANPRALGTNPRAVAERLRKEQAQAITEARRMEERKEQELLDAEYVDLTPEQMKDLWDKTLAAMKKKATDFRDQEEKRKEIIAGIYRKSEAFCEERQRQRAQGDFAMPSPDAPGRSILPPELTPEEKKKALAVTLEKMHSSLRKMLVRVEEQRVEKGEEWTSSEIVRLTKGMKDMMSGSIATGLQGGTLTPEEGALMAERVANI